MTRIGKLAVSALMLIVLACASPALAQQTETRLALVVGNSAYQPGGPVTAANDAGLLAQTLQAAGFDVVGARDLDLDTLRRTFRDFLDKATVSGPNTVAFVYFSGYALQLEGENYLVPVDAKLARDTDVPIEALRLSDYTKALAGLHLKAMFVVVDAARATPFAKGGQPLASGLALMEPDPGELIAFNATPGTVAPDEPEPYGTYAQGLVEMLREGGIPPAEVFDRLRLRVNDLSQGAEVPWDESKIESPFVFFERAADAPPPPVANDQVAAIRARPIRDLGAREAYLVALDRDTITGYEEFLAAYPQDPMAKRARAMLAARREALVWRHTYIVGTPEAYWSYLRRYPDGPHAWDARRRLRRLAAALEPPPSFALIAYDVPPPPPEEVVYVDRPVLVFSDPVFGFAPPPPPPIYLLPPRPPELIVLPPPPRPTVAFVLPAPAFVPVPAYVNAPRYVAPPPNNAIFVNIHQTTIINNNGAAGGRPGAPAAAPPAPALSPCVVKPGSPHPANAPGAAGAPPAGNRGAVGNLPTGNTPPAAAAPAGSARPAQPASTQPGQTPGNHGLPAAQQNRPASAQPATAPGAAPAAPAVSSRTAPSNQPAQSATGGGQQQGRPGRRPAASASTNHAPASTGPGSPPAQTAHPNAPPVASAAHSAPPPTPPAMARPVTTPPPTVAKPAPPAGPAVAHVPPAAAVAHPPPPAVTHAPPPAVAARPAPPQPHQAAAHAAPRPACPAGKSMQTVNGHQVCR